MVPLKHGTRRVDTGVVKHVSVQVPCPQCGAPNSAFDRYCSGCAARTSWTFADRWHATPTSVRICVISQWLDALAAGCLFAILAIQGGRGLRAAAPWQTNLRSHVDVFALSIASGVALILAVLVGTVAALAYVCGSDMLRRRPTAWRLSVCWLCLAAVVTVFLGLDLLVLLVICVQLGTLFTSGARDHMLHPDPLVL